MTGKIFRSTFLTSLLVLISCIVLIFGVLFDVFEKQITKELADEVKYIAYAVENGNNGILETPSSDDKRITLISPDGTVLADTIADTDGMDNHADREEVKQALEFGSGTGSRYSKTLMEKTLYYAIKLKSGNILRVSTTQYSVAAILLGLLQPMIFILFAALVLSFLLSSKVAKNIIKPINSIDLDNPENSDTYEELTPLLHKILNQNKIISKQIESARHMQKEFKLITEKMNEGFLIIDKYSNLLSCNSAALRLLDAKKSEGSVLALNRSEKFREAINSVLGGKRAESTMLHDDRVYSLIANPVTESGETVGAVIVIIDITESAERENIRREFTANVSHELKTPLTSISGFAELMMNGSLPDDTVKDFSKTIYSEAQRLISLVSDIIKISELDEKSEQFMSEPVDLFELSHDVAARLKMSAGKKNITINLFGASAFVFGVKQILDEMIFNLCDNAIKYNKENGSVDVIINTTADKVKLSVKDTGIGIPTSQQDRIFERFYRVDKSRSKAVGGTGLGLSIVKHGAMYHGAEIKLESEVDKGTIITISFDKYIPDEN